MNINNHNADQREARLTVDIQTNCDGVRKAKDCCIWKAALEEIVLQIEQENRMLHNRK